jgi:transcriptional regulator with XRE-family HTH domain
MMGKVTMSRDTIHPFTPEQTRRYQDLLINTRKQRGLTQQRVGDEVGIPQTTLSIIERTPNNSVSFIDACKLLNYYRISPTRLASILGLWEEGEDNEELVTQADEMRAIFARIPQEMQPHAARAVKALLESMTAPPDPK